MSSFSNDLENKLLDHVFKTAPYSVPSNLYLALCTSTVLDSSSGTSLPGEVSGGNYARKVCNTWDAAAAGATENSQPVTFNQATADWGTITHFAVCDHLSTGNVIGHAALTAPKAVSSADTASFATGELDVTLA